MSLITDPNYLVHQMRIKFLRTDERGERMISFNPNVMTNDYIRTAAPVYPEMHLCYSPVYDNPLAMGPSNLLTNSPRTMRSGFRSRKKDATSPVHPAATAAMPDDSIKASMESAEYYDMEDVEVTG
jgi:hypothetical protein